MRLALELSLDSDDGVPSFAPSGVSAVYLWTEGDTGTGSSWTDKSAAGVNSPAQATPSLQPTIVAATKNGRAAYVFDGTDDRIGKVIAGITQTNVIWIAAKWNSSVVSGTLIDGSSGNTMRLFRSGASQLTMYAGVARAFTADPENWHIYKCTFNGASSSVEDETGAVLLAAGNIGANTTAGIALGNFGVAGGDAAAASMLGVVAHSGIPSAGTDASIMAYMRARYRI